MNKIRRITISILIGLLFVFCLNCFLLPEKKVELEHLKSPNGERKAILKISESGSIYLTTKTQEKFIDKGFSIYSGTNLFGEKRRDFVEICPTRKWLNDRILFFGFRVISEAKKA